MKIEAPPGAIITRVSRGGRTRYRLRIRIGGEYRPGGVWPSVEEARAHAIAQLEATGALPAGLTVGAWGERRLADLEEQGVRSVKSMRQVWEQRVVGSELEHMLVREVRPQHVRQWMDALGRERLTRGRRRSELLREQTLRNALTVLSAAFGAAVDAGHARSNPCAGIRVPKRPRTDDPFTYLEVDGLRAVMAFAFPREAIRQRVAIVVAIFSGLREGELWGLRWEDVHLDCPEPYAIARFGSSKKNAPTKGGRVRRVALLGPAVDALRELRELGGVRRMTGHVFVGRRGPHARGYDAGWADRWREAIGLPREITFHSFRRTHGYHLRRGTWGKAWSLDDIQRQLGHKSRATTERHYAHLGPDSIEAVAAETRVEVAQSWHRGE